MNTVNTTRPIRFVRGDLAHRIQARRDARQLAEVLRIEALLHACHVRA